MLNTRLPTDCTAARRNLQGDCDPYSGPVARDGVLEALNLPSYTGLLDAQPLQLANEQFRQLGRRGLVSLVASPGRVRSMSGGCCMARAWHRSTTGPPHTGGAGCALSEGKP